MRGPGGSTTGSVVQLDGLEVVVRVGTWSGLPSGS